MPLSKLGKILPALLLAFGSALLPSLAAAQCTVNCTPPSSGGGTDPWACVTPSTITVNQGVDTTITVGMYTVGEYYDGQNIVDLGDLDIQGAGQVTGLPAGATFVLKNETPGSGTFTGAQGCFTLHITASAAAGTYNVTWQPDIIGEDQLFGGSSSITYSPGFPPILPGTWVPGFTLVISGSGGGGNSLDFTTQNTDVKCKGQSNGSITVNATGGTPPYMYQLGSGASGSSSTFSNLAAGSYNITVTDNAGGSKTTSVTINEPSAALVASASTTTQVTCKGMSTGAVNATASGGTGAYSYSWNSNPAQMTQAASNLPAGTYIVTVTDANGCMDTASAIVTEPSNGVSVTVSKQDASSCTAADGSATANVQGGSTPYTYSWNTTPAQTTAMATGLKAGDYIITVTDNNGCQATGNTTVGSPNNLHVSVSSTPETSCGAKDGTATATVTGAAGTVLYLWNTTPPQTKQTATKLKAGVYTVTVSDASGCQAMAADTVASSGAGLTVTPTATAATGCNTMDGSISTTSNGVAPVNYTLMPGSVTNTTGTFSNLGTGVYTVMATDANGCSGSGTANVTAPGAITADFTYQPAQPTVGQTVNFTNTSSDLSATFQWLVDGTPAGSSQDLSQSFNSAGSHTVTLIGTASGCSDTVTKTLNVSNTVGVAGLVSASEAVRLMPNPASSSVTLRFPLTATQVQVRIYNHLGQLVRSHSVETVNLQATLDISDLSSGVYLLHFQGSGLNTQTQRLMVK